MMKMNFIKSLRERRIDTIKDILDNCKKKMVFLNKLVRLNNNNPWILEDDCKKQLQE